MKKKYHTTREQFLKPIAPRERLTPEVLFQPGWEEAFTGEEIVIVRDYLSHFIAPHYDEEKKRHCEMCGAEMDGFKQALGLGAAFQWGLVHGEAFCSNCRYPARGHHFVKLPDGTEIFNLQNLYLMYWNIEDGETTNEEPVATD
jgi:hypothetical protein